MVVDIVHHVAGGGGPGVEESGVGGWEGGKGYVSGAGEDVVLEGELVSESSLLWNGKMISS